MATCSMCGRKYNPNTAEREYDNDSYISRHGLEGTYGNFINMCADCAVEEAMSAYPNGSDD